MGAACRRRKNSIFIAAFRQPAGVDCDDANYYRGDDDCARPHAVRRKCVIFCGGHDFYRCLPFGDSRCCNRCVAHFVNSQRRTRKSWAGGGNGDFRLVARIWRRQGVRVAADNGDAKCRNRERVAGGLFRARNCRCIIGFFCWLRFVREPAADEITEHKKSQTDSTNVAFSPQIVSRQIADLYVRPVAGFVSQYKLKLSLLLLAFIFFFKIGEAFLGRMSVVFYKEAGFSISDIGLISGGLGTITVCIFAIFGSAINARYGLFRGVLIGGIAMASTNILLACLAFYPERWLFAVAAVADQFTTSVSTVAFVAFLSQLCERRYAATQYAALASLGNLSRTTLAASSGLLVDALGGNWFLFFIITALMVLPSLAILVFNRARLAPVMSGGTHS